jgi:hypothetical protein
MRREQVIEGIEFGLNDFQPMVRGARPLSRSSRQPNRSKEFKLALVFTCVGALIIAGFHTIKRDSGHESFRQRQQVRTSRISESQPQVVYAVQKDSYPSRNPEPSSHSRTPAYASLKNNSMGYYSDKELERIKVKLNSLAQRIDEFLDDEQ